jgi:hypothetical protein
MKTTYSSATHKKNSRAKMAAKLAIFTSGMFFGSFVTVVGLVALHLI